MVSKSKGLLTVASIGLAAHSMTTLKSNQGELATKCDYVAQQLKFCTINSMEHDSKDCIHIAQTFNVFCPVKQDVAEIEACLKQGKSTCKELALSQMGLSNSVHAVTRRIGREIKELKALASGGAQVPELKRQILSLLCYLRGLDLNRMVPFRKVHEMIRDNDDFFPNDLGLILNKTERNPEVASELGNDDGGWEAHGPGLGEDDRMLKLNPGLSVVGGSQGDGDGANNTSFFAEDEGAEPFIREHLRDLMHKLEQLLWVPEAPSAVPPRSLGSKFLALFKRDTPLSDHQQLRDMILRQDFW